MDSLLVTFVFGFSAGVFVASTIISAALFVLLLHQQEMPDAPEKG